MNNVLLVGAGVISALGFASNASADMAIASEATNKISELANDKYGTELSAANDILDKARKKLGVLDRAEQKEMKDRLDLSDEYKIASANAQAAKTKIDILKAAIKKTESDKTQVAVGSGESAVAVNITNSGAKAKLEADLAEATAAHKTNVDICNTIKSRVAQSVRSNRGEDWFIAEQEVKEANENVNAIENSIAAYKSKLASDPKYKLSATVNNMNETAIIGLAAAKSALPAVALYCIWDDAIKKLDVLKKAKEML
jgi:hypothetical protein